MKKSLITFAAICMGASIASPAMAGDDLQLYATGALNYSTYDFPGYYPTTFDDNSWGYKLAVGAEFPITDSGITIGPEIGWVDYGDIENSGGPDAKSDGWYYGGRAAVPITEDKKTRITAHVGRIRLTVGEGGLSVTSTVWYYGGGADTEVADNVRVGVDVTALEADVPGGGETDYLTYGGFVSFRF